MLAEALRYRHMKPLATLQTPLNQMRKAILEEQIVSARSIRFRLKYKTLFLLVLDRSGAKYAVV